MTKAEAAAAKTRPTKRELAEAGGALRRFIAAGRIRLP
jgi:hypothetical protein